MQRLTTMQAKGMAKSKLRKAVTGDPDKKIRDYMTEVPQVYLTAASLFRFQKFISEMKNFLFTNFTCINLNFVSFSCFHVPSIKVLDSFKSLLAEKAPATS
jgi:hypothetical protein